MMAEYMGLENFKAVYVVDLCHSLCEVAKQKVKAKGWKNVHVVEGDACQFTPPEGTATLVTFSYSLTSGCPWCAESSHASTACSLAWEPCLRSLWEMLVSHCLLLLQHLGNHARGPCKMLPVIMRMQREHTHAR